MQPNLWIIDAFTKVPFRGNAAAVSIEKAFPPKEKMQMTALLANLSETAFVVPKSEKEFDLKWFTPEAEVNLCGHATLATAHVLLKTGLAKLGDTLSFNTLSGKLEAELLENDAIELNFPLLPGQSCEVDPALKALGVNMLDVQRNRDNDLVLVKDFEALLACRPDYKALSYQEMQGVIVTTNTGVPEGFDFASRYFGPKLGVNEDPVTGSAHCFLAPYWAKKLGKNEFMAYQASIGKGELRVRIENDRCYVSGYCKTAIQGKQPD